MTTSSQPRLGTAARAERRLIVQLSVAAVSMATLAISWLGITSAERATVAQPTDTQVAVASSQPGTLTTLAPAPATSNTTVVRRSRAS